MVLWLTWGPGTGYNPDSLMCYVAAVEDIEYT